MIFGILSSKSVQLASIIRSLHESIDLKKTQERLSRNLQSFSNADYTDVLIELASSFRSKVGRFTTVIIDHADISKTYARKMEGLAYVWDGSRKAAADLAMLAAAFAAVLCISKANRQLYWFLFDQAHRATTYISFSGLCCR
jgi:hypothetical protein